MLLVEADGKRLFRAGGMAVPQGVRVRSAASVPALPGVGPWIAKVQVQAGGRGKAGGVRRIERAEDAPAVLRQLLGLRIKGCEAREVLIEEAAQGSEHYVALMVDAGAAQVRMMHSAAGGVDIEAQAHAGAMFNVLVPLDADALREAARTQLAPTLPEDCRAGVVATVERLAEVLLKHGLLLAEINPLFVAPGGACVAGDAKVVLDLSAVDGDPLLEELLSEGRELYPDAWRKRTEDFDFVELDRHGQVGLVTTGAGLSMMVIDELVQQGLKPFNFCDMRTGQMRGSPQRLLRIFDWLDAAPDVRVVLVNIFAGITDLSEFTQLLVDALKARPQFRRPVVARLVGNGQARAKEIIAAHPELNVIFVQDLDTGIRQLARLLSLSGAHGEVAHAV